MAAFNPQRSAILACLLAGLLGAACPVVSAFPLAGPSLVTTPQVPRAKRHEYRHAIERLEDAWRDAMLKSNGDAMAGLLADDYTGITAQGEIQTKEQTLNNLRSGALHLTALSIDDRKIRIYGATAVVTSKAELSGTRNAEQLDGRYRYTRVYVRNSGGTWKIVSFEASRIQESGDHK